MVVVGHNAEAIDGLTKDDPVLKAAEAAVVGGFGMNGDREEFALCVEFFGEFGDECGVFVSEAAVERFVVDVDAVVVVCEDFVDDVLDVVFAPSRVGEEGWDGIDGEDVVNGGDDEDVFAVCQFDEGYVACVSAVEEVSAGVGGVPEGADFIEDVGICFKGGAVYGIEGVGEPCRDVASRFGMKASGALFNGGDDILKDCARWYAFW